MPTLNYDPTEADMPEFSEEEQDSLKVGEQAFAEQERMLAGKFNDPAELEKAYLELQRKMGAGEQPEVEQQQEEPEDKLTSLVNQTRDAEEPDYSIFEGMDPQEVAKSFYESAPQSSGRDLTEAEVNSVYNSVGGQEAYAELMQWSNENFDPVVVSAFDELVESGNVAAIQLAVTGLVAQYENSNGRDGNLLSGKGAPPNVDVFRSQAEVVRAMNDPKYDTDPAYRQDVFDKLGRSNLDTY